MIKTFLSPEGHQNLISGSKVTAILLKGWILPICGASSVEGPQSFIVYLIKYIITMWNSRSLCGAESVADRRSLHCWTSWLALDKENHWRSTPAVAPDGWVQWALHNMLQSVAARWRCTKLFWNQKFPGSHPYNYLFSQTLLNINDYVTGLYPRPYNFSL